MSFPMKKFISILSISLLFIIAIFVLFQRQEERLLSNNDNRICLNEHLDKHVFSDVLLRNAYVDSQEDAKLISEWLIDSLLKKGEKLPNIGSLNSRVFQIPNLLIEKKGGSGLKQRLMSSYNDLGCDSISLQEYENFKNKSIYFNPSDSCCAITASVRKSKKILNFLPVKEPVEGIPIRLKEYKIVHDPINNTPIKEEYIVAYATTNDKGEATFYVNKDGFYSVLPFNRGFEYGIPKGTTQGEPIGEVDAEFSFIQKEHRLRMFDKATFARIKADGAFCVRTVSDYITGLVKISILFILSWWCSFFFVSWRDKKLIRSDYSKYKASDCGIISLLMLLNAICIFTMLAITNPLTDRDYASEMIIGTLFGCIGFCVCSFFDYVKYYSGQSRIKFDIISSWIKKRTWCQKYHVADKIPEGIGFLLVAFVFIVLLRLFGTGPEGSTARVNLWFFQPSEISKFFFVTAIALFFTANASKIQAFAEGRHIKAQFKTLIWIVISVLILLFLYIVLISDMGPALVLAVTFILLYSIVRRDLGQMFVGVLSYIAVLSFANHLTSLDKINTLPQNSLAIVLYLSLFWYIIWFAGGYFWKKKIYESAGFMNLLILLFTHGGEILNMLGLSNQGQRLMNRILASGDGVWDNTVRGGDQVAQGIWALASGGFWGQGLGNGNANLVPAFHTDMVFESIGEIMGFITLFVILICYALLVKKCLIRAKESGHPFLFYLIAGIGIVTAVQLFVIIMGSLGIVPLTGVSLPFLSYGKAGLVINLAAFGVILGMSRNNPTIKQKESIIGYQSVIRSGISIFTLFFAVIIAYAFNYQVISRDTYLTKPAYITNLAGEHFPEQNPRINLLFRNIHSGNIYDRNGLLLATSNPDTLLLYKEALVKAGITAKSIDSLAHCSKKRYYPFGDHMFFMLGDMNTRNLSQSVFSKDPYGYLAEERHIDSLRGLSVPYDNITITRVHSISPFLPDSIYNDDWQLPQYGKNSTIVHMLEDGVNGKLVNDWNQKRQTRDMTLTIDALLQLRLQKAMEDFSKKKDNRLRDASRFSVVMLSADNGDLLCSANYPLPNQNKIVNLFNKRKYTYEYDEATGRYTERDLGLTYQTQPGSTAKIFSAAAGLNKNVNTATDKIKIYSDERIHTGTGAEPYGEIDMKTAIVKSSNCFFVHLVHKDRLYEYLIPLYMNTGVRVGFNIPYIFNLSEISDSTKYAQGINSISQKAYNKYDNYMLDRKKGEYREINFHDCAMAWGQGEMRASPLNMARMTSIVANDGMLRSTRYLLGDSIHSISCLDKENAILLQNFMRDEAKSHPATNFYAKSESINMGGKTGTPTRIFNDGWYVCFFNSNKGKIALALRIEQCQGSSVATKWINEVIMPTLKDVGYIN